MSRCGKKGGIPKKFHREMKKDAGINVPRGVAEYGLWIRKAWRDLGPAGKAPYLLKRGFNKNSKGEACIRKPKPKRPTNTTLPSNAWIKKRAPNSLEAWKAFKKERRGKAEPSKKTTMDWMTANGFSAETIACYELRRKGYICTAKAKRFDGSLVTRLGFLVKPKGVGPKLNIQHKGNAIIPAANANIPPAGVGIPVNADPLAPKVDIKPAAKPRAAAKPKAPTKAAIKKAVLKDAKKTLAETTMAVGLGTMTEIQKEEILNIVNDALVQNGLTWSDVAKFKG